MIPVKILLLLIGILCVTAIPIQRPAIGSVEDAVHSAADTVAEGEQVITKIDLLGQIIARQIRAALEKFKDKMVDNIELLGFPRLEPLDINHIDIDIKHEIGVFDGTMDNVKIMHLSTFETRDVAVSAVNLVKNGSLNVDINLFFEKIEIFGDYDIDANVGDLFHVFGKGPFHLTLHDVNTFVSLKLITDGKYVQIDDIGIKVELGSLSSHFSDLMGGGDPEELFNKVIEEIAPEAVEVLWPEIEPILTVKMKEEGNKKLSEVTLAELLKLFG